jgi:formylglycine-generating enzyme required for sulfatase activity
MNVIIVIGFIISFWQCSNAVETPLTVDIPAGEFSSFWLAPANKRTDEKKVENLHVQSFEKMVFAVTGADCEQFLNKNSEWKKENISTIFADESYLDNLKDSKISKLAPMTSVSWFAARAYCASQNMRLPTINEWEYMAAASEKVLNANSEPQFLKRILDWYSEPQNGALKEVGHIYKNKYGLWDMHGLIWEWVDDFNSNFVSGESREDSSFNKNLFCGSGALTGADKENYAGFMRFAFRSSLKGKSSVWNLGFRCVRSK